MKNLTEFSGIILRRAAKVRHEKLSELKAAAPATADTTETATTEDVVVQVPPADGSENVEAVAATSEAPSESEGVAESEDVAAPQAPVTAPEEGAEVVAASDDAGETPASDTAPADGAESKPASPAIDEAALAAAVGQEMGMSDDRLKYLLGALKAVGRKGAGNVRNVRVFQGEEAPPRSVTIDELHYVIDLVAKPQASNARDGKGRDGKGGKGGGSRGRSGGGGGFDRGGFDRPPRDTKPGEVPSGGLGWSLSRAPGEEKKERAGRKGPRRGKKPGGNRPNENRNRSRPQGGARPMPEVIVKPSGVAPTDKK